MANVDKIEISSAEMRTDFSRELGIDEIRYVKYERDIQLDISSWYVDHDNNVLSLTFKNEEPSIHGIVIPPRVELNLSKVKEIITEILK